jgi:hypothetical protein
VAEHRAGVRAAMTSERKNHGRGHSYYIDGEKVVGVTTALGNGYPKKALIDWAANTTAEYAIDRWDELAALPLSQRLAQMKRARWDVQKAASVRGTQVHEIAQRLAAGEEIDVPEPLIGHVDAYLAFAREWRPRELYVERPVFSRRYHYAGTPDLVAELADGKTWLLDWKTAAKGVYLDNVLQLAALRFAEYLLDDDEHTEVPLPKIDATGIVWLRADGYDLVPVEAGEEAWRVFLYALKVGAYASDDSQNWIGDALLPPARLAVVGDV